MVEMYAFPFSRMHVDNGHRRSPTASNSTNASTRSLDSVPPLSMVHAHALPSSKNSPQHQPEPHPKTMVARPPLCGTEHALLVGCSLHLQMEELPGFSTGHELGPVGCHAQQRARSVEGTAPLLDAHRGAVALCNVASPVDGDAVALALLNQLQRACSEGWQ